jgi:photosystem II stability/assembly factor-like uncharacterized protein
MGDVFAETSSGIFRSGNNGDNWTKVNDSLSILTINSNGDIFACDGLSNLYRSTDNGDNWTTIGSGLTDIIILHLITYSIGNVLAETNYGIFRSSDNGDNWTKINSLTDFTAFVVNSKGIIYGATFDNGIFKSSDNGDNWTAINSGLTNLDVYCLAVNTDGYLFAGCLIYGGVFRSIQSTTSLNDKDNRTPSKFSLSQNYPNPFNPTTNFEFRIANFGFISLKVYDILGNEVETIVNEELPAGNYKYQWNASELASGVYFYQLKAGKLIDTKKLILMK